MNMKRLTSNKILLILFVFLIVYNIVVFSWIGLEYVLDGSVIEQKSDEIIAILLSGLICNIVIKKLCTPNNVIEIKRDVNIVGRR